MNASRIPSEVKFPLLTFYFYILLSVAATFKHEMQKPKPTNQKKNQKKQNN